MAYLIGAWAAVPISIFVLHIDPVIAFASTAVVVTGLAIVFRMSPTRIETDRTGEFVDGGEG